jgi:hypothetical protein
MRYSLGPFISGVPVDGMGMLLKADRVDVGNVVRWHAGPGTMVRPLRLTGGLGTGLS